MVGTAVGVTEADVLVAVGATDVAVGGSGVLVAVGGKAVAVGVAVGGKVSVTAPGEIQVGEWMTIESILGTTFRSKVLKTTRFGPFDAVIPEVEGTAYYTGQNEFWIDPDDPLKEGFILR